MLLRQLQTVKIPPGCRIHGDAEHRAAMPWLGARRGSERRIVYRLDIVPLIVAVFIRPSGRQNRSRWLPATTEPTTRRSTSQERGRIIVDAKKREAEAAG
jgi:hypothetical protein